MNCKKSSKAFLEYTLLCNNIIDKYIKYQKMIWQYVRDRKNRKVGVVIAYRTDEGNIMLGWSLCNKKDKFDKTIALNKATQRAKHIGVFQKIGNRIWSYNMEDNVPRSITNTFINVSERAKRYYKDCK